jgi:DNA segregation ATPase FtsK/SpoIIIE-like protein
MENQFYLQAVAYVLRHTDATQRRVFRRVKLAGGIPFRFLGPPVAGPQCVTVTIQIRDEDLKMVLGLSDRLAMAASSRFARTYRDLAVVRIEFTLPKAQWREVHLSRLNHRPGLATIGQKALGPLARVDWSTPHKSIFGATRSGKTICLADLIISLAQTHQPDDYQFLILNPKNDPALRPFSRLVHLAAPVANTYDDCTNLLRFALAEMECRRQDNWLTRRRLVVVVDEIAQLTQVNPETGPMITQLSQLAGGLNINLVVASQAANPSVFGGTGSLAKANFGSRIVFQLPREQAYLATGIEGQATDKLGGNGDGLAVTNGRVTRFRAALPSENDYHLLPRTEAEPEPPAPDQLAGDSAVDWQIDPDRLAYALVIKNSATAIRQQFGGGTASAMQVRDYANLLRKQVKYWRRVKAKEARL